MIAHRTVGRPRPSGTGTLRRILACGALGLVSVGASLSSPTASAAQVRLRSNEVRLLRDAANRESQGDFEGAAAILRGVLEDDPGSSGALFALERVLRSMGRPGELLPHVDRFLQRESSSSGVRYLKLRVLTDIDSLDAVRSTAEGWLAEDPADVSSYREIALVYERAFGRDEALGLLRRGRDASGDPDALALEIGDFLADAGDREGALHEWARAVATDDGRTVPVIRRVQALDGDVTTAARTLVSSVAEGGGLAQERSATRIALDLALEAESLELARDVTGRLGGRERETFLADVARRAREQELVSVAAWAYDELGDGASSPSDRRQFDLRIVELALTAGDTVGALEAQRRVAESYSRGSVDRRRAAAEVIRLESAGAEPQRLETLLAGFRADFPNAPELDGLASSVAAALASRGDLPGAARVLEGVDGPRSSLESGYLLLGSGDLEGGRGALLLAVTGLPPDVATDVIQFASLLDRVSADGAVLLAEAGVAGHRGDPRGGATTLADGAGALPESDRPVLLAEAARMAERGGAPELAADINTVIVADHGDAFEAGEASLSLARYYAARPDGVDEAIRLLENLITERPNAAVVPDARLELERLRSRGR